MIKIIDNKCDFFFFFLGVCPPNCIEIREASIQIEHDLCIDCNLCVYICPIEVLEIADKI